jgi:hypothetical protein
MDLEDPFGMLIFLCIFEILGGAALGAALRSLARRDVSGLFFLIWGGGFAGIPFVIGAVTFLSAHQATYFYAQAFVLLTMIVTVGLLPDDFLQGGRETGGAEGGAIVGAVMTMIGGAVVLFNLRGGLGIGLVIGGFFAFLGAILLIRTAIGVLRSS